MMLLPHSVSVYAPTIKQVSGKPGGVTFAGSATVVSCQITPMTAGAVFDDEGAEVSRPHLLMGLPATATSFVINAKVVLGSRTFYVVRPPEIFTGINTTAQNFSCVLREDK